MTIEADEVVKSQRAESDLLRDQFVASIQSRAIDAFASDGQRANAIAEAAIAFVDTCIRDRALGVALTLGDGASGRSYHLVALLQSLHSFMGQLENVEEAIALSHLVQGVLSSPSQAERKYIGVALQAQFAIHLLGYDPHTLQARVDQLSDALLVVDSSTLIPFLARSCIGHDAARGLLAQLRKLGCLLATTPLLSTEVAEHARYALTRIDESSGAPTHATYRATGGWAGERSNAFLDGFLRKIAVGLSSPSLFDYLRKCCGLALKQRRCTDDCVEEALVGEGIICKSFQSWDGFDPLLWAEREELQDEIARKRRDMGTYRHPRQTDAEAEAVLVVRGIRSGQLRYGDAKQRNAFFISRSRVVDDAASPGTPVTMSPEAVSQWAATLTACGVDELALLTDRLLWEMSEHGVSIVDMRLLQSAFGPMVDASKESLEEAKQRHRDLLAEMYGEDPGKAFATVGDYEYPVVVDAYYVQIARGLQQKLEDERREKQVAQSRAILTDSERQELETLKIERKLREQQSKHRRRSRENKKARGGKKGKRKK